MSILNDFLDPEVFSKNSNFNSNAIDYGDFESQMNQSTSGTRDVTDHILKGELDPYRDYLFKLKSRPQLNLIHNATKLDPAGGYILTFTDPFNGRELTFNSEELPKYTNMIMNDGLIVGSHNLKKFVGLEDTDGKELSFEELKNKAGIEDFSPGIGGEMQYIPPVEAPEISVAVKKDFDTSVGVKDNINPNDDLKQKSEYFKKSVSVNNLNILNHITKASYNLNVSLNIPNPNIYKFIRENLDMDDEMKKQLDNDFLNMILGEHLSDIIDSIRNDIKINGLGIRENNGIVNEFINNNEFISDEDYSKMSMDDELKMTPNI